MDRVFDPPLGSIFGLLAPSELIRDTLMGIPNFPEILWCPAILLRHEMVLRWVRRLWWDNECKDMSGFIRG
jgi:hypothetical protein